LSVRAWLQRYDTVPDGPLLIQMPLAWQESIHRVWQSVGRRANSHPVQLDDPVQVLTNLHTATDRLNTARTRDAEKPF